MKKRNGFTQGIAEEHDREEYVPVNCSICGEEIEECGHCGRLIEDEETIFCFDDKELNGEQHLCVDCMEKLHPLHPKNKKDKG